MFIDGTNSKFGLRDFPFSYHGQIREDKYSNPEQEIVLRDWFNYLTFRGKKSIFIQLVSLNLIFVVLLTLQVPGEKLWWATPEQYIWYIIYTNCLLSSSIFSHYNLIKYFWNLVGFFSDPITFPSKRPEYHMAWLRNLCISRCCSIILSHYNGWPLWELATNKSREQYTYGLKRTLLSMFRFWITPLWNGSGH